MGEVTCDIGAAAGVGHRVVTHLSYRVNGVRFEIKHQVLDCKI